MDRARTEGAHRYRASIANLALDPAFKVFAADLKVDEALYLVALERLGQAFVGRFEDRLGEVRGAKADLEGAAQVPVVIEAQARADVGEEIDDLVDVEPVEILQRSSLDRQFLSKLAQIGGKKLAAAAGLRLQCHAHRRHYPNPKPRPHKTAIGAWCFSKTR